MKPTFARPPFDADERTSLLGWLELQRKILRWKCEGLDESLAHRAPVPTSPLMTMAGLISHMRWVEHLWLDVLFLGGDKADNPSFDESVEDAEWRVEGTTLQQQLDAYEAQCLRSDEIIAAASFDDHGRHPDFEGRTGNLRWMLNHLLEETARHAGHADLLRELLDGEKGYY